ncbi:MAG: NAD(P)-binding protein, partial [Leptolyngbyaceae cyanobacterium bins.59]|nr:NAD(P)-binding protein [Leptolyngbyaceae cyanobacterium bins.59]
MGNQVVKAETQASDFQLGLDYDLAIVGSGIVGATLACAVQGSGLRVALIEAQPTAVATAKGQAYAISLLSSRIFCGLGI